MLALVALTGLTCARRRSREDLEPVHVLLPATGSTSPCAADDEIRPTLACAALVPIATEMGIEPDGAVLHRRYRLPTSLGEGRFVIEPRIRFASRAAWRMLPPSVTRLSPGQDIEVSLPLPPDAPAGPVDVNVRTRPIPAAVQTTETAPLAIGRGAILRVGIAMDQVGGDSDASPAEFRLLARSPAGERELIRAILDPADPGAHKWHDYRLDLDALAGASARFVFSTHVVPRPGQAEPFSFPLWGAPEILEPRPRGDERNLVLVSVDTLRADHVGAYGCELPTTPVLDRLAREGVLFEQAVSAYPSTPASHMTMMTGVYPAVHGVVGPLDALPNGIPTLAELLAAHGYQTAAVTEDAMLVAAAGFQRGIRYYRENKGTSIWDASGQVDVTFAAGLRWLEQHRREKFFLFLHTYQVHEPYSPPPAFNLFTTYQENGTEHPITQQTPLAIRARHAYAGEVRYVDSEIGRLLEGIAALGEADRTLVVITSDHGEEFYEHGWKAHDESLYDEVLRVPLIMWGPGLVPAGVRVPLQVSLVDLAPTLLDLLGLPVPSTMQGISLVPLLENPTAPTFANHVAFSELDKKKQPYLLGARAGGLKWIFPEVPGRQPEVYDLRTDPGEHRNIATAELLARGEALIAQYRSTSTAARDRLAGKAGPVPSPPVLDERTMEKLRALGYIQ